jgi:hypothetical protein
MRGLAILLALASIAATPLGDLPDDAELAVAAPANDNGTHLDVTWDATAPEGFVFVVSRHAARGADAAALPTTFEKAPRAGDDLGGGWTVVYAGFAETTFTDEVDPGGAYVYAFQAVQQQDTGWGASNPRLSRAIEPDAALINTRHLFYLALVVLTGVAFWIWFRIAKVRGKDLFIRRIAGIDAIEDAVGRSTEMGRPVLYVTGMEDMQDIQTIASLLILGHVSKTIAEYDTDLLVCNAYPMTMIVAEEVVRQGYANAGRLDAHRPENVMFLTAEQFAFAAAVTGIIMRDKPATNIYFGRYYAESLLLAETGYLTGAVQIAGTSEFTQLPFFIAACDYALLGEELYAVGAYLSREPTLLAQLKAGDVVKAVIMALILLGTATATFAAWNLGNWLMP